MVRTFFMGGSPCSGKSTIAEILSSKYETTYYKLDDHLEDYTQRGVKEGNVLLTKVSKMTLDENWLRTPEEQNEEEFAIYDAFFPYILEDIKALGQDKIIIAEGTGLVPKLMKQIDISHNQYICMVPSKEFQIEKYSKRTWAMEYLEGCSDKEQAFQNWMERDILFAADAKRDADLLGYALIVVDGTKSIEENLKIVEDMFCNLFHKDS